MTKRQRDRAQLLGQVPLFSYCSQRELAKVAKLANELELPALAGLEPRTSWVRSRHCRRSASISTPGGARSCRIKAQLGTLFGF
jgi:hypothetical protein